MKKNVLILGSGGREHALAWKISQSPVLGQLFVAPGNAGTEMMPGCKNLPLNLKDFEAVKQAVLEHKVGLVVVGPEDPLADGIVDFFGSDDELSKITIFGPKKEAAKLESSKIWAKKFMKRHGIPTADFVFFTPEHTDIIATLKSMPLPHVIKADGLAAGKGVIISNSFEESVKTIQEMFEGKFGDAGKQIIVEQFLQGVELSVFIITDGDNYVILPTAKDYKKVGEDDTGPNTGGMGAVSPVPFADVIFMNEVEKSIIQPTVDGLKKENIDYWGFIYFGLMVVDGKCYVLEYNARMGDPETQVVLPRIETDLLPIFEAAFTGDLHGVELQIRNEFCATVVLASHGYPGTYEKGKVIVGLDGNLVDKHNSFVFHAGTKLGEKGKVLTNGGRVLAVSALGANVKQAVVNAKCSADGIGFDGMFSRQDIGHEFWQYAAAQTQG